MIETPQIKEYGDEPKSGKLNKILGWYGEE
jgi:hypothetical protein